MNRRRFLSCALVLFVPVADAGVFVGMDWTTTAQPVFSEHAAKFLAALKQLVADINEINARAVAVTDDIRVMQSQVERLRDSAPTA